MSQSTGASNGAGFPSGTDVNVNLVNIQRTLAALNNTLANLTATNTLPNYTFATLPATAATGSMAFVTNGRKPGEGGGAGTGITVFFNTPTLSWFTTLGVGVTA